jgi:hypothetical protein
LLLLGAKVDLADRPGGSVMVHSVLDPANLGLITAADGHRRGQIAVRLIAFSETPDKPSNQPDAPSQSSALLSLDFDAAAVSGRFEKWRPVYSTAQSKARPLSFAVRSKRCSQSSAGTLDMPIGVPAHD